ncbi:MULTISPECIES: UDP-3-O-(3-hydroxymyristoyl)glucosamine N-acyltransferase [unclassified Anaerobiospirillum]|uniref:UDP-3-O-(3-hydroxymyristoyl)glucosamine N-acyltransferase n=1 Tax=unclassified Anaerobiospirillum TaxID=2647410 RepID=UPI001FF166EE|nr:MULTISPECIES: UDP-3-O-(3-hydroxymyristoyl)glucosamine N-acyltransferase [unclassified Anaerobiospirillum]MCK0534682.1 UDP-3-O-(3-hydroxymyristoyl)glucosamine N-acyltransferase [Anaerobiospirillum sp. NML120511]MCK0539938.1 UDP-3-O-(3-hydroxymyristoyl)glucosamine N-acyltransferase [Anaerobiospirillum sp. NML02-A-032]
MLVKDIAAQLNAEFTGNGELDIARVANLKTAGPDEISFLSDVRYRDVLETTAAGCVMVKPEFREHVKGTALVLADPYLGFARVAQMLDTTPAIAKGIHPAAFVEEGAKLGNNVSLGPHVVISAGAVIGDNVQIGANCVIGPEAVIGDNTKLYPGVSVYHHCVIGNNCLIQSGTVIGSDGFGYANDKGTWVKIPQSGRVVIGDFVEIGANTCIDRGAIDDTIIESNVIIDNLCQIAHNVKIGFGTAIAGGTTFAGSVTIGKFCIIGGTSVFNGHITIADQVTISGMCMVMRSIEEKGATYSSGIPAQTNSEWRRTASRVLHINDMYRRMMDLEKEVKALKNKD